MLMFTILWGEKLTVVTYLCFYYSTSKKFLGKNASDFWLGTKKASITTGFSILYSLLQKGILHFVARLKKWQAT
ncbi:hypothetical protein A9Q75_07145 [Colwellia psychrerythraea]|uniref:Uncharacterized protein n=1 Tax=Colwellia psychrerythraea TaxID=28229 RepID=A0A1Y5EKR4_COLPS|nr:hypothetical protein A9Q75_07145 [Colwellia psychrerythraea]